MAAKITLTLKNTANQILVMDLQNSELKSCKCCHLATLTSLLSKMQWFV